MNNKKIPGTLNKNIIMLTATVERRLYTRIWSEIPVKIYYGNTLLTECTTVNLSVGGLLIRTKDIGLMENSLVQVMFDLYSSHCLYEVKIPAVVLRCENSQIAAAFETLEKGTEELINARYLNGYPEYF